jgi:hypothetical protein
MKSPRFPKGADFILGELGLIKPSLFTHYH